MSEPTTTAYEDTTPVLNALEAIPSSSHQSETVSARPHRRPLRNYAAAALGTASLLIPGAKAVVVAADFGKVHDTSQAVEHGLDQANRLIYEQVSPEAELENTSRLDQAVAPEIVRLDEAGRLHLTIPASENPPTLKKVDIDVSVDTLIQTKNSVNELKTLGLAGAAGLVSATALHKRRRFSHPEDIIENNPFFRDRGLVAAGLVFSAITIAGLWEGQVSQDLEALQNVDTAEVSHLSEQLQMQLEKIDLTIEKTDEGALDVAFTPDPQTLDLIQEKIAELQAHSPKFSAYSDSLSGVFFSMIPATMLMGYGTYRNTRDSLALRSGQAAKEKDRLMEGARAAVATALDTENPTEHWTRIREQLKTDYRANIRLAHDPRTIERRVATALDTAFQEKDKRKR